MSIVLIDASEDSLTVSWPPIPNTQCYTLEYKSDADFTLLSDKLSSTQARKRNLSADTEYWFRVKNGDGYITHETVFVTLKAGTVRLSAPTVSLAGTNQALLVSWEKQNEDETYTLQMRENVGGQEWTTIAENLETTQIRKKNLTGVGYQFRVGNKSGYSEPSSVGVALGLSSPIQNLFRNLEEGTLLRGVANKIPLADALGGKEFILFYVSAHWCGPCRNFTPKLVQWYQKQRPPTVEVVFLSADHDESSFQSYYQDMPWLAVDYDEYEREQLQGWLKVRGIPRLAVVSGRTGKIVVDNAVGQTLNVQAWRNLV